MRIRTKNKNLVNDKGSGLSDVYQLNEYKEARQLAHERFMGKSKEYSKLPQNDKLEIYFRELEVAQLGTQEDFDKLAKRMKAANETKVDLNKPKAINIRAESVRMVTSRNGQTITFNNQDQQERLKQSLFYQKSKDKDISKETVDGFVLKSKDDKKNDKEIGEEFHKRNNFK